jgi:broad specificity phosphatase PhoE
MKIILLRHGQTHFNALGRIQGHMDIPLSHAGEEEARAIAGRVMEIAGSGGIGAIYSSDLKRAMQTALALQKRLQEAGVQIEVIGRPDLREINLGKWQGKTRQELMAVREPGGLSLFEMWLQSPAEVTPPGGEAMAGFFRRSVEAVLAIASAGTPVDKAAAVFTHGGVISMLLNYLEGRTPVNFVKFSFPNGGGTILEYRNGRLSEIERFEIQ